MALKKIDKETAIKLILSDLKKGISKMSIIQKLSINYNNSLKSFYNYFDAAEILYKEFLAKATPIIEAKEIEALGEAAKMGILSKLERQKILSEIARGEIQLIKYMVADGVIHDMPIVPNWTDRKNAIAELNKMDGAYIEIDNENEFKGFEIDEI